MNQYFVCLPGSVEPVAWDPTNANDRPIADCNYFGAVLALFEAAQHDARWTFYLTWDVRRLPSVGPSVVAIVLGDEWCRTPLYADRVAAVFKCYGTRRHWPRPHFNLVWLLTIVQWTRIECARASFVIADRIKSLEGKTKRLFDVPLGYYNQIDLPIIPIAERRYDVWFAGSVIQERNNRFSVRGLFRAPKTLSRERMLRSLDRYRSSHPDRAVEIHTTVSFGASATADPIPYSSALQQTKCCVVPRGTSLETFRWFEGLRYGCVVICEELPSRAYYDGAPVIVVEDWNALPDLLDKLLADAKTLQSFEERALRWWNDICSEQAIAKRIGNELDVLKPQTFQTCAD